MAKPATGYTYRPEHAFLRLIHENPNARGIALVVANQHGSHHGQRELRGVEKDLHTMTATFQQLKFAVFKLFNVSVECIMSVLQEAAQCTKYPPTYRRLAFTFSGHGTLGHICTYNGDLKIDDILEAFQPHNAPSLGSVPKFFFIDACQGEERMYPIVVPRGGNDISMLSAPLGNTLLATSTLPRFTAYETEDGGGVWMSILSHKLLTSRSVVSGVLEEVNAEIRRRYEAGRPCQQPLQINSINEEVRLLVEAEEISFGERRVTYTVCYTDSTHTVLCILCRQSAGWCREQWCPVSTQCKWPQGHASPVLCDSAWPLNQSLREQCPLPFWSSYQKSGIGYSP